MKKIVIFIYIFYTSFSPILYADLDHQNEECKKIAEKILLWCTIDRKENTLLFDQCIQSRTSFEIFNNNARDIKLDYKVIKVRLDPSDFQELEIYCYTISIKGESISFQNTNSNIASAYHNWQSVMHREKKPFFFLYDPADKALNNFLYLIPSKIRVTLMKKLLQSTK